MITKYFNLIVRNFKKSKSSKKSRVDFTEPELKGFVNFAFHDYLAARNLLSAGLSTQGVILCVTALEKLLKAVCLLSNGTIRVGAGGHDLKKLMNSIQRIDEQFFNSDELKFMRYINKAYRLRYPDNLKSPFKIILPSMKILENLDSLFCRIIEKEPLSNLNPGGTMYDAMKNVNAHKLKNINVHFNESLRKQLSNQVQKFDSHEIVGIGLDSKFYHKTEICRADQEWNSTL